MGPGWAWDAEADAGPASRASRREKQPLMPEVGAGGLGCHPQRRSGWNLPQVACWLPAWLGQHSVWFPNGPGLPGEPGALSWEMVRIVCLLANLVKRLPLRWSELGCWGQSIGVSREQPSAGSSGPGAGLPPSASLLTMGSGAGCQAARHSCAGHEGAAVFGPMPCSPSWVAWPGSQSSGKKGGCLFLHTQTHLTYTFS